MDVDNAQHSAEERLTRWVREHAGSVRGYLLGLVRRADVADDLLQEVFRRAWQSCERYREEGHERAFLLKIADRLVIDRSRRLGLEVNLDEQSWREIEPDAPLDLPLDQLSRDETSEELVTMLNKLSFAQRQVLLLRFYSDLTFEEIAAAIGCPLGTALSHCRRGLATLRKRMTAET